MKPEMAKKLRCYLGSHRWQTVRVADGGRHRKCRDCGKVRFPEDMPPPLVGPGTQGLGS